jgi:dihydrofolate reductase
VLVFGRRTYEMMAGYWPTAAARANSPAVAERMNALPKVVFSTTLASSPWQNTRVLHGDAVTEVRRLKQEPGDDMAILGSGSLVLQLLSAGLLDELQLVVNPVVLGRGKALFAGIPRSVRLRLARSRVFGNGNAFLCYEPQA